MTRKRSPTKHRTTPVTTRRFNRFGNTARPCINGMGTVHKLYALCAEHQNVQV